MNEQLDVDFLRKHLTAWCENKHPHEVELVERMLEKLSRLDAQEREYIYDTGWSVLYNQLEERAG